MSFVVISKVREFPSLNSSSGPICSDFQAHRKRRQSFLPEKLSPINDDSKMFQHLVSDQTPPTSCVFEKATVTNFVTGSKYVGQFNALGIAGKGLYRFPHGVVYNGQFNKNGEFHGNGTLIYPNGQQIQGSWHRGKFNTDSLSQRRTSKENYCKFPDRRFRREIESDLQPAYQENLTKEEPPRIIPTGCYDSGEGFYDPNLRLVKPYKHEDQCWVPTSETFGKRYQSLITTLSNADKDLLKMLRSWTTDDNPQIKAVPNTEWENWVTRNCRKAWDETTGFRPDLYETWTSGSKNTKDTATNDLDTSDSDDSSSGSSITVCFRSMVSVVQEQESSIFNKSNPKISVSTMFMYDAVETKLADSVTMEKQRKTWFEYPRTQDPLKIRICTKTKPKELVLPKLE